MGRFLVKEYKLPALRQIQSGDQMHGMVIISDDSVSHV